MLGEGRVYLVRSMGAAQLCQPGEPLHYELTYQILQAGDRVGFPSGESEAEVRSLLVRELEVTPAEPY